MSRLMNTEDFEALVAAGYHCEVRNDEDGGCKYRPAKWSDKDCLYACEHCEKLPKEPHE